MVNRRNVIGGIGAGLLCGPALGAAGRSRNPAAVAPNVVFIMADDLGYADLSITGSRHIRTPAIDSIGQQGVFVEQGYSSTPICSPTRTALLTGRYAQRLAIGLEEPIGSAMPPGARVPHDQPTLASVFKARGYRTGLLGKWHLGPPPESGPLRYGYDHFLGIVEGGADYFLHRLTMGGKPAGTGLVENDKVIERPGYLTDVLGDEAVRLIEAPGDQPFFLSLHFTAPHWPWEGREDEALARRIGNSFHYDGGSLAKFREMVEAMDQNVAKVLAALERSGKADNTIVVFTSDNGGERFSDTWPYIGHKGEVLEGGIRVPLLVRWPRRIRPGSRTGQVMASMDFLPTLLAMAGGDPAMAGRFDGMDLSAQLTGAAPAVERTIFWRMKADSQAAVRRGDWKYVRIADRQYLFNLAEDARESANAAAANPGRLAEMKGLWDDWNRQMLPYPLDSFSQSNRNSYTDRYR
jgi:arylsulfatase A-like enzyme